MDIKIIVIMMLKNVFVKVLNEIGMTVSTASMSLLNLFMIRPSGVDSKNFILLFRTDSNIEPCKTFDEFISIFM